MGVGLRGGQLGDLSLKIGNGAVEDWIIMFSIGNIIDLIHKNCASDFY